MNLPENDYQILRLTDAFFQKYPNPPFIEILKKRKRAYNCLLFQTHYNYFICIPYRTEITHPYAYRFRKSMRSRKHKSGLDYTKIVIISNTKFIDNKDALVDKDEYNETMRNLERIRREALMFVEDYIEHIKGNKMLSIEEFRRRYTYSSLKYFHDKLIK